MYGKNEKRYRDKKSYKYKKKKKRERGYVS